MPQAADILRDLPDDLLDRHWAPVMSETRIVPSEASQAYDAVYMRPFDPRADNPKAALIVRREDRFRFRISTRALACGSWEDARLQAIELMRAVDARRP